LVLVDEGHQFQQVVHIAEVEVVSLLS
jgi:hypothetical protein